MRSASTTKENNLENGEDLLAAQNIISDLEKSAKNVQYDSLRIEEASPIEKISEHKARIKCASGVYIIKLDDLPCNGAVFNDDSFVSKLFNYDTFYVTLCDIPLTSTSDTFILQTSLFNIMDKAEFFEKYAASDGHVPISKEKESKYYDMGLAARTYSSLATVALFSFLTNFSLIGPVVAFVNGYIANPLAVVSLMMSLPFMWAIPLAMILLNCSYRGKPIESSKITNTDNDSSEWKVVSGAVNWNKEENTLTIEASSGEIWRYNTSPVGELRGEAANVFSNIDVISTDSIILYLQKVPSECTGARRTNTNGKWMINDVEL